MGPVVYSEERQCSRHVETKICPVARQTGCVVFVNISWECDGTLYHKDVRC